MARTEEQGPAPALGVVGGVRGVGLQPTAGGESTFMYSPASVASLPAPPQVIVRVRGDAVEFEQKLREIGAILTGHAGDHGRFAARHAFFAGRHALFF